MAENATLIKIKYFYTKTINLSGVVSQKNIIKTINFLHWLQIISNCCLEIDGDIKITQQPIYAEVIRPGRCLGKSARFRL